MERKGLRDDGTSEEYSDRWDKWDRKDGGKGDEWDDGMMEERGK